MGFFSRSRTAPLPDYASMPVEERVKDPRFQQAFAHLPGFDDAVLVQNADHGALIDPPTELLPSVKIGVFVITPSHMGYAYVESGQPKNVQLATTGSEGGPAPQGDDVHHPVLRGSAQTLELSHRKP